MKQLLGLVILLTLVGCSQDEILQNDSICAANESQFINDRRSIHEATQIVIDALPMIESNTSRSSQRTFDIKNIKPIIGRTSRSNTAPDTLMYVFNFDNEDGFALVSATKSTEGLIAITEQGQYDPDVPIENPGLSMYIDMAKNYIIESKFDSISSIGDTPKSMNSGLNIYKVKRDTTILDEIKPLINGKWGQYFPEGIYCENGKSGCSNTAVFMVMTYFEHPSEMDITFPDAITNHISINWPYIKRHTKSAETKESAPWCKLFCYEEGHQQIALICRELGYRAGSTYFTNTTSTGWSMSYENLENLGFNTSKRYYTTCSSSIICNGLKDGEIIFMQGRADAGGHAWLMDGYRHFQIHKVEQIWNGNKLLEENDLGYTYHLYSHLNWGWNGDSNGYYSQNVFDNQQPQTKDNGTSLKEEHYNFNKSIEYVFVKLVEP